MRITVLDDDPGKRISPGAERYEVRLDGKIIKYFLTADDDKGLVICAVADDKGRMKAVNGEVEKTTLYGTVEIRRMP
ncbi:TPA: hypothetical protein NKO55_000304 [Enterobacter asburiae]|nr:hypothetical protein [Enterobacter asburiae]